MAQRAFNVLFVCEKNSVRSIMAEALLNRFGDGRFRAFSAGVDPDKEIHPLTTETLKASGLTAYSLEPKNLRDFIASSEPKMDFVITLGKEAPSLIANVPGNPFNARWGITDPREAKSDPTSQKLAFRRTARELENRIRLFVLLRHQPLVEHGLERSSQV